MKQINNWDDIQEAGTGLPALEIKPGAYIVKITEVKDFENEEYLKLWFEFFDGEYKGACESYKKENGDWPYAGTTIRSYKESAHSFFKGFITAIEKSNAKLNYHWNWDERTLVGKYCVAVFGEHEFEKKDGTIGVGCQCVEIRSIDALRDKKIVIPPLKKLKAKAAAPTVAPTKDNFGGFNISDDDLPF